LGVVGHSDVWAAAVEKMEEACFYSQVFHGPQKTSSDVSNDLVQISEDLLVHNFSAGYSMEDLKVFVDGRHTQELQQEDAMRMGIVVDSTSVGK
jgi:hypothetical protein